MRPLIGVTSGRRLVPSSNRETRATVLYTTYTTMIRHAGGTPVVLTPGPADEAVAIVGRLDGLVLSGGGDVDPARYGSDDGSPIAGLYGVDPDRDEYEIALVLAARETGLPTLAICRGLQVLNVALGGSLIGDIATEEGRYLDHTIEGPGSVEPQHSVMMDPSAILTQILGSTTPQVNSIHHQAIRDLGEGLRVVGTAPDGIIEAVEPIDSRWPMWGVQWHPEYLGIGHEPSVALFRSLVETASR